LYLKPRLIVAKQTRKGLFAKYAQSGK